MSSESNESKSETGDVTNNKNRKNLLEDFASIESKSPPKRVLRSATATPSKGGATEQDLFMKGTRVKETPRKPLILLSPKKAGSQSTEFPNRLMPLKDIPSTGKINSYSKPDYLAHIAGVLRGTDYLEALLKSPLGSLFRLPASKVALSGKLTHNILCRMLPTRKRHEIWFVFANRPIRFSLKEFAAVTGLPCGPKPTDPYFAECSTLADTNDDPNSYWNELMVGCIKSGLLKDIANLLWDDPKTKEEDLRVFRKERAKLTKKKKMRLCLVLLVDGVLCPRSSSKMANKSTVEYVKDISMFLKYPWGRESFDLSIECVKTVSQSTNSIQSTVKKLKKQTHFLLKGLSIAFQLLFFVAVPALGEIAVEDSDDEKHIVAHPDVVELETNLRFNNTDILKIDNDHNTPVVSLVDGPFSVVGVDLSWSDEVTDVLVDNMVSCISVGYDFKNTIWSKDEVEGSTHAGSSKYRKGATKKPPKPQTVKKLKSRSSPISIEEDPDEFIYNPDDHIDRYLYEALRPQTELEIIEERRIIEKKFWRNLKALSVKCKSDNFFDVEVAPDNLPVHHPSAESESQSDASGSKRSMKAKGKSTDVKHDSVYEDTESDDDWLMESRMGTSGIDSGKTAYNIDLMKNAVDCTSGNESVLPSQSGQEVKEKKPASNSGNSSVVPTKTGHVRVEKKTADGTSGNESVVLSQSAHNRKETNDVQTTSPNEHVVLSKSSIEQKEVVPQIIVKSTEEEQRGNEAQNIRQPFGFIVSHKTSEKIQESQHPISVAAEVKVVNASAGHENNDEENPEAIPNPLINIGVKRRRNTEVEIGLPTQQLQEVTSSKPAEGSFEVCHLEDIYVTKKNKVDDQTNLEADWTGIEFLKVPTGSVKDDHIAIHSKHPTEVTPPLDPSYGFTRPSEAKIRAFFKKVDTYKSPEYLLYNLTVPRGIFRQLAAPTIHHMELMIGAVWERLGEGLKANRTVILGTGLCHFIESDAASYKAKNGDPFDWDINLANMVNGNYFGPGAAAAWMVNVDRVYAPMQWPDKHWVGLCIELVTGTVTVFDSFINLVSPQKADKLMAPLLETLPLMISDLAAGMGAAYTPPAVFVYTRPGDVPQVERAGDSGPLAVKFMELHSQGITFPGFTDSIIDDMRVHYAVDVFERFMYTLD